MKQTRPVSCQPPKSKPVSTHGDIQQYTRVTKRFENSVAVQTASHTKSRQIETGKLQRSAKRSRDSEDSSSNSDHESTSVVECSKSKRCKTDNSTKELLFPTSNRSASKRRSLTNASSSSQSETYLERASQSPTLNDSPLTTPSDVQPESEISTENLPKELLDLFTLNISFLKALSLHYAHHGSISPVDTRTLRSVVAKIWGERSVTLEDIQRCIGGIQMDRCFTPSAEINKTVAFSLLDYGNSRICVERPEIPDYSTMVRHLDVESLQDRFEGALCERWDNAPDDEDISAFITQLPLAPITVCPSLGKSTTTSQISGQRRLEDLKGIALKSRTLSRPPPSRGVAKTTSTLNQRSTSLLERLKSKEADRSTRPSPPSPAEIARRAALRRLPDIIATLPLPRSESSGSQRTSYALPMLVQTVQDSSRSVVGKEEVEGCLRLLAEEGTVFGAEGFVKFVGVGLAEAVVVNWSRRPGDLMERVRAAV